MFEVNELDLSEEGNAKASKYPGGRSFLNMIHQFEVHLQDHAETSNHQFKLKGYIPADGSSLHDEFQAMKGQFNIDDASDYFN